MREIILAAHEGRVATLFVPIAAQCWGRFDPDTGKVTLETGPTAGNDDLLDLSAVYTIVQRGQVYACQEADLPDTPLAAVFRYSIGGS